jgi:hypothetical protein
LAQIIGMLKQAEVGVPVAVIRKGERSLPPQLYRQVVTSEPTSQIALPMTQSTLETELRASHRALCETIQLATKRLAIYYGR